jgi:hypothetical protein
MSRSTSGCGCSRLGLLLGLAACGDPLVGERYLGEPMLSFWGTVFVSDGAADTDPDADVGVAVVWNPGPSGEQLRPEEKLTTETDFPARYVINLLAPPIPEVMHTLPDGTDNRGSIGLVVVYRDVNGNGRAELAHEALLGVAEDIAVIWHEGPEEGVEASPTEPPRGYGVVRRTAEQCGGLPPERVDEVTEPVDIVMGDICEAVIDPDCNPDTNEWGPICGDVAPPGTPPPGGPPP